jgi:hypothetical protein
MDQEILLVMKYWQLGCGVPEVLGKDGEVAGEGRTVLL